MKRRKGSPPRHRKSTSTRKTNTARPSTSFPLISAESQRKDARAREAATSEILQLISEFRSDIQPVFDAIAQRAKDLCSAEWAAVHRYDGQFVYFNAHAGFTAESVAVLSTQVFPYRPAEGGTGIARALRERKPVHIDDLRADTAWRFPVMKALPDYRTVLMVPMLRRDEPLGVISVGRSVVRPFSDEQIKLLQIFASQAVIAIENVRLFKELHERNAALTESLDQQTATSEILRVISQSPTDVQPVFDAIVTNAVRLCEAATGGLLRFRDGVLDVVATTSVGQEMSRLREFYPYRVTNPEIAVAQAVLDRRNVHIKDVFDEPMNDARRHAVSLLGYRTFLAVPLLGENTAYGVIIVWRTEVRPFSDKQIALLATFAQQAVIAIENVGLFQQLQQRNGQLTEALEQQTATSDILRVISSSPTDIHPVLDAVAKNAARLCEANDALIFRVDGDELEVMTVYGPLGVHGGHTRQPISRGWVTGRAVVDRKTIHIHDLAAEPETEFPLGRALRSLGGHRTTLATPLLREHIPLGAILIRRKEVRPFTDKQIELLQTFADQAVIAIENVRLFKELQHRNAQLTETLDQQTASSEILRIIANSRTDVQPVFETIVRNAVRLCGAVHGGVYRFDGELVHSVAHHGYTAEQVETWQRTWPRPVTAASAACEAIRTGSIVRITDIENDPRLSQLAPDVLTNLRARGSKSLLAVPMFRQAEVIGAISLAHRGLDGFTDAHVALLKTFADQAVIAIENVRLFKELQVRNADLTEALEQQTATADILRVISSSPTRTQPVFDAILRSAVSLCDAMFGVVLEYDGEVIRPIADHNLSPEHLRIQRQRYPLRPSEGGFIGIAVSTGDIVRSDDVLNDPRALQPEIARRIGYNAFLAVPIIRDGRVIGALGLARIRQFSDKNIALIRMFADQAGIAIENARLFEELQEKSRQLEGANRHKDEFLASMSHELRTPLNAVIGFSEVLLERMFGDVNEKQEEYLNDILASGRHLLSLINDILDLTKIEAGRMELDAEEFDVSVAIDNALVLVRERATRKGLSLDWKTDGKLAAIHADQRKFKQILLNLLSNALKFTPEGGRIELRAGMRNGNLEVSVTDTGVGIAKEDHATVFEEFRQVGDAVQRREGTGLGLALSRKFVELHGGRMWLESEPGKGSTFTFTLPTTHHSSL